MSDVGLLSHGPPSGEKGELRCLETILLVEDDENLRRLLYVCLARAGYTVLTAIDGAHAIRFCESFSDPIHLVVSDIVMPQIGGIELRRRLAALRPGVKVLLMSGYSESELACPNLRLEEVGFLQKPFQPADFLSRVRQLLSVTV